MKRKAIVVAALAGLLLAGGIAWFAMRPAPLTYGLNASKNELVIECDGARFEDAQNLGVVRVGEGESLQIRGTVNRGSVDVIFTSDTKRFTAHLEMGFTKTSKVTAREGDWRVRVVPRGDNTKATVRVFKRSLTSEPALGFIVEDDGAEVVADYPLANE